MCACVCGPLLPDNYYLVEYVSRWKLYIVVRATCNKRCHFIHFTFLSSLHVHVSFSGTCESGFCFFFLLFVYFLVFGAWQKTSILYAYHIGKGWGDVSLFPFLYLKHATWSTGIHCIDSLKYSFGMHIVISRNAIAYKARDKNEAHEIMFIEPFMLLTDNFSQFHIRS